ncbi:hypothetical protein NC652_004893 [Populus alba x Populus x berolinensis]|nr:hypothetical protein NC652_004893 [Populus alba x Populus x berolinensis]
MLVTTRNSLELLSSILKAETEPKPIKQVISQYEELEAGIKSREQLPESSDNTGASMLPAQLGHQNETKIADYPIGADIFPLNIMIKPRQQIPTKERVQNLAVRRKLMKENSVVKVLKAGVSEIWNSSLVERRLLQRCHCYSPSTGTRRHLTTLEMENRLKRKQATAFTYGPIPSTSSARLCDVNRKPNSMDARSSDR